MENTQLNLNKGRVLVDFYADWCGPCKSMSPILEEFTDQIKEVKLIKIDVDKDHETSIKFGIKSIPCFVYMEDGEIVQKGIGIKTVLQLKEMCGL
jgi:thioredoxin 1